MSLNLSRDLIFHMTHTIFPINTHTFVMHHKIQLTYHCEKTDNLHDRDSLMLVQICKDRESRK